MLIIHEVMGRNCGWLTAATALEYRKLVEQMAFVPEIGLSRERREVHGVFIPEIALDIAAEAARLRQIMDQHDCVNLFVSEGACVSSIVAQIEARGEEVPRDAFGHVRLDKVNVGAWFARQFAEMIGAEKTLVQKSGYYSRAAAANAADRKLIKRCATKAVQCAFAGKGGVVGEDEERGDKLRAVEFERIKGGKPFNVQSEWFVQMLKEIGQPMGAVVQVQH
jgi:pyrophosphate--fructose-6-phosphate 1-phosphotransferase